MIGPASDSPLSLTEQFVHSTVRIKTRVTGETGWSTVGTGFYWNTVLAGGHEFSAIVTNRHVLQDAVALGVQLHLKDGSGGVAFGPGKEVVIENDKLVLVFHEDPDVDLALVALGPTIHHTVPTPFFRALTSADLPDETTIRTLSAAQDILMVGYPNGLSDEINNCPVIRRGSTAIPPWLDYEGQRNLLCDVPVFGGSSGSPIFVVFDGMRHQRDGTVTFGTRKIFLLGVLFAGHVLNAEGEIVPEAPAMLTKVTTPQTINLGLCVKAERVRELIEQALVKLGIV